MKILVIGTGGREHALTWRLKQNGHELFAASGNPATNYLQLAQDLKPDLTVVGPEAPLVAGVVDDFRSRNLKIVGPTKANAQLEASKTFSKRFMDQAGIPTARSTQVDTIEDAQRALTTFELPVVIKADGLAAGKGVIIAQTHQEAAQAVQALGPKLVIEEFLHGEEVSFIWRSDPRTGRAAGRARRGRTYR